MGTTSTDQPQPAATTCDPTHPESVALREISQVIRQHAGTATADFATMGLGLLREYIARPEVVGLWLARLQDRLRAAARNDLDDPDVWH